jgi:hypothetical protein
MNQWTLTFPACVDYSAHDKITVEIDLISGALPVTVGAKLDSCSKFCSSVVRRESLVGDEVLE